MKMMLALAALLCGGNEPVQERVYVPPPVLVEASLADVPPDRIRTVRICVERYWEADVSLCFGPPLQMTVEDAVLYAKIELIRLEDSRAYVAEICELMPNGALPQALAERKRHCRLSGIANK